MLTKLKNIFSSYLAPARRVWVKNVCPPDLTGYSCSESFAMGQNARFCIHNSMRVRASFYWLNKTAELIPWSEELAPKVQSSNYDYWRGYEWDENLNLPTHGLSSGLYLLRLTSVEDKNHFFSIAFIIKPIERTDVVVVSSTNTWNAYNNFAGLSNYTDTATPFLLRGLANAMRLLNIRLRFGDRHVFPSVPLPTNRPNLAIDEDVRDVHSCPTEHLSHLVRGEWSLLKHLHQYQARYGVFSDKDFSFDPVISSAKLIILNTHAEYWSDEMWGRLKIFVDNGGKAAFISGNNLYRKVVFYEHGVVVTENKVESEKIAGFIGLGYDSSGYLSNSCYQVCDPKHWVFDNANVDLGQSFAPAAPVDGVGASGYETDKLRSTSTNVHLLAMGANAIGPAAMTFKKCGSGGWIFNAGSVACSPWLDKDSVLNSVFKNLLSNALDDD